MLDIVDLWLPILASTAAVFFLSFLCWAVSPHHKQDWIALPGEDRLMDSLREQGVQAGQYAFPRCEDAQQMREAAFLEKYNRGPKGFLIVAPEGPLNMARNMATSSAFNLIATMLVAYVASLALAPGAEDRAVFRLVSTVAFIAHGAALGWAPIWFGRTWSSTLREMGDALLYGLGTGAIFMALWPSGISINS